MKYTFESQEQKEKRLSVWRRWFAWHPIWMGNDLVWLQYVERCKIHNYFVGFITYYRFIKGAKP